VTPGYVVSVAGAVGARAVARSRRDGHRGPGCSGPSDPSAAALRRPRNSSTDTAGSHRPKGQHHPSCPSRPSSAPSCPPRGRIHRAQRSSRLRGSPTCRRCPPGGPMRRARPIRRQKPPPGGPKPQRVSPFRPLRPPGGHASPRPAGWPRDRRQARPVSPATATAAVSRGRSSAGGRGGGPGGGHRRFRRPGRPAAPRPSPAHSTSRTLWWP